MYELERKSRGRTERHLLRPAGMVPGKLGRCTAPSERRESARMEFIRSFFSDALRKGETKRKALNRPTKKQRTQTG